MNKPRPALERALAELGHVPGNSLGLNLNEIGIIDPFNPNLIGTENCAYCGNDTGVKKSADISCRPNYVEGLGQLCQRCAIKYERYLFEG